MNRVTALAVASAIVFSASALAQTAEGGRPDAPDPSLPPNYGSISLTGGFSPDPHSIDLRAGGDINAREWDSNCRGWITESPDYVVNYTQGVSNALSFSVGSDADTTLVVNTPSGEWVCNDDSQGLNPALQVSSPTAGAYRVWVGTYANRGGHAAALHVTNGPYNFATYGDAQLNPSGAANYGETSLSSPFNEQVVEVRAGGDRTARSVGGSCIGFVTSTPDYRVSYEGGGGLTIGVTAEHDVTLVVRAPDGTYHCNDDFGGSLNSQLTINGATAGDYAIWAGTYSATAGTPEAQIRISDAGAASAGGGDGKPGEAAPSGGSSAGGPTGSAGHTALNSGFLPDPYVANVPIGATVAASSVAPQCAGFVPDAPTFSLDYTAQLYQLFISVSGGSGVNLVVRAPNGQVYCDAGANSGNGGITWGDPQSGRYDIWVGSTSQGATGTASLNISEIGYF